MTLYLTHTDSTAQPAIRLMVRAFPAYTGHMFKIDTRESVDIRSCWDGGSREYFKFVRLDSGEVSPAIPSQSGFDRPMAGADAVTLPEGTALVTHTIFCGKDMGLTLTISPANAPALLPVQTALTDIEAYVLIATASLKNTYGGETDIRFRRVAARFGTTRAEWETAVQRLISARLLLKSGAITPDGRNAIASHPLRHTIN